jgi:catechol 2,3-dioxygenase-like lactoylglutathione lyase family enzyme
LSDPNIHQHLKHAQTKRAGVLAVHSVDEFVFSVPKLEDAINYYENFGLRVVKETFNGQTALGLYTVKHTHRWGRVLEGGEKKRLQWVTYGIYAEDLEAFRAHLMKSGVELIDSLDPSSDASKSIWFRHPDGLALQIRVAEKTSPSSALTPNYPPPCTDHGRAPNGSKVPFIRPIHLSHLLMFTPHVNRAQAFYTDVLGLRLSDSAGDDLIAFMHSPHGSDHHLIALFTSSDYGLHHTSWAVASIDEVGLGMKQMAKAGFDKGWGVGRHVLGSNYFRYVRDPWGSYCEYSFDIDFIPHTLDWPTANHPPEDSLYVWGPDLPEDFVTNYEAA